MKAENPPAFPQPCYVKLDDEGAALKGSIECFGGMTLRDFFAAQALPQAWESEHHKPTHGPEPTFIGVAERAYLIADAMLAERSKQ